MGDLVLSAVTILPRSGDSPVRFKNLWPREASVMKWTLVLLLGAILGLGVAAATVANELNDPLEDGSVLVFPRFVARSAGRSSFTVDVDALTKPAGVKIRAHWVCPPATGDRLRICKETNFNLHPVGGTVTGSVSFNTNGGFLPNGVFIPKPPCAKGFLILWVINEFGLPIKQDVLTGSATVNGTSYDAFPIQAVGAAKTVLDGKAPVDLVFDGKTAYKLLTGTVSIETDGFTTALLTLLTLDMDSNRPNHLLSGSTYPVKVDAAVEFAEKTDGRGDAQLTRRFTCWTQVTLGPLAAGTLTVTASKPFTLIGLLQEDGADTADLLENIGEGQATTFHAH
jgi:hypothetical protein